MKSTFTCPACGGRDYRLFCQARDRLGLGSNPEYRILSCAECGLGRTEPWIDPAEIHRWYPPAYYGEVERPVSEFLSGTWHGTSSWRGEAEKARVVERFRRGGRILDVGCAEGKFLWALDGGRWDRWGLEFNRELVRRVEGRIPGVRLVAGNLGESGLEVGRFDVITLWHVLEHIADPAAALKAVHALLADQGLLVISLPRLDSLQARLFKRHWYAFSDVPRHYYHYSRLGLTLLLRRHGFSPQAHLFFSRRVNFHCWKYSLRSWVESGFGSQMLYYPLKPLLHLCSGWERLSGQYGTLTTVASRVET